MEIFLGCGAIFARTLAARVHDGEPGQNAPLQCPTYLSLLINTTQSNGRRGHWKGIFVGHWKGVFCRDSQSIPNVLGFTVTASPVTVGGDDLKTQDTDFLRISHRRD